MTLLVTQKICKQSKKKQTTFIISDIAFIFLPVFLACSSDLCFYLHTSFIVSAVNSPFLT